MNCFSGTRQGEVSLEVADRIVATMDDSHADEHDTGPQAEDHLDLTEEVEEVLGDGPFLILERQVLEALDAEGMQDGDTE